MVLPQDILESCQYDFLFRLRLETQAALALCLNVLLRWRLSSILVGRRLGLQKMEKRG